MNVEILCKKVELSLRQPMEAYEVVRCRGSHISQTKAHI
jgi:hypothetical protein